MFAAIGADGYISIVKAFVSVKTGRHSMMVNVKKQMPSDATSMNPQCMMGAVSKYNFEPKPVPKSKVGTRMWEWMRAFPSPTWE